MDLERSKNNFAYIDGANLKKASESFGWQIDYVRFRIWLTDKHAVSKAYMFFGYLPELEYRYRYLREIGFELVFREVIEDSHKKLKGNCDADLIIKAVRDVYEADFGKAVIVSSDGDFAGLIGFLIEKERLEQVISPAPESKCSALIKKSTTLISYLETQKAALAASRVRKLPAGTKPRKDLHHGSTDAHKYNPL